MAYKGHRENPGRGSGERGRDISLCLSIEGWRERAEQAPGMALLFRMQLASAGLGEAVPLFYTIQEGLGATYN